MAKLKKIIKNNKKVFISFIMGLLISTGMVYVYAETYLYSASNVRYDNTRSGLTSSDIQSAIDEIKVSCTKYTVDLVVVNGTASGESLKTIRMGKTETFTVNSSTGYTATGATVNCTNSQTAILSGTTLTTGAITGNSTCTVTFVPQIYEVTLDNQSATSAGTGKIYEKYNTGYYLNSEATTEMTTSTNGITVPTKDNYIFGGYYTQTSGGGTQYIDANGKITSSANTKNFTSGGTLYAKWTPNKHTVTVNVTNGTPATQSKEVNYNTSTTFTVSPNTNYGGGQVSCTNSQTATLSGTTLTTGNITSDTVCTVTFELGAACSGASGTTNGYCPYGQSCKTGSSSYCSGGYQDVCTGGYATTGCDCSAMNACVSSCYLCSGSGLGACTSGCQSAYPCTGCTETCQGWTSQCQGWSSYSYNYCG